MMAAKQVFDAIKQEHATSDAGCGSGRACEEARTTALLRSSRRAAKQTFAPCRCRRWSCLRRDRRRVRAPCGLLGLGAAKEAATALLTRLLRLQLRDLCLCRIQCVLLQQAALYKQINRIGLVGQTLVDQRIGLRIFSYAADGGQALKEIVEEGLFLGSHGFTD
ncbi:hypothetical protein GCM10007901_28030 [Dyella acidisoli]|uniref:Uncharacterized protein n=1 Tax=Dyella acidisoli TaxID=1867834 RepID=A0ABQ5XR34_9GAMM|nr:hypothetical protein GCM10007901_28030 [Dyella acidisoli]